VALNATLPLCSRQEDGPKRIPLLDAAGSTGTRVMRWANKRAFVVFGGLWYAVPVGPEREGVWLDPRGYGMRVCDSRWLVRPVRDL